MNVVSVNAGRAELMKLGARTVSTGIRKAPVERGYAGALGAHGRRRRRRGEPRRPRPGALRLERRGQRFPSENGHPTVADVMDVWYDSEPDPAVLERLLAAPIAERARVKLARKLELAKTS